MNNVEAKQWTKEEAVENIMDSIGDVGHLCSDIVDGIFDGLRDRIEPNDIISEDEVEQLAAKYVSSIDSAAIEAGEFYDDVIRDEIDAVVERTIKTVFKVYSND